MNTEQPHVAIDATFSNHQAAEQPLQGENQEIKEYYLRLIRQMCPRLNPDKTDCESLYTLNTHTQHIIEMLTLFEHSWAEEMLILQKAILTYVALDNIPRKERQRVIDAWTEWSDYQFQHARYRGLLADFIQYHHHIGQEVNSLLHPADDVSDSEIKSSGKEVCDGI